MDPRAPRHRAAFILAVLFTSAFLLVVAAEVLNVLLSGIELTDPATTLMLSTGSLLVGINGSFLARYLYAPPPLYSLHTLVGVMMAVALGGMVFILGVALVAAVFIPGAVETLSDNTLNVLAVIFTGIIGSLAGYLGFNKSDEK
jgi:hypothetical protein